MILRKVTIYDNLVICYLILFNFLTLSKISGIRPRWLYRNTNAHDRFIDCAAISLHSFWQAFGILEKGISIAVTWITSLTIFNIQNRFDASAAEDFQNHCSKSNITKSFVFCHNAFNFIRKFYFIYFQYLFTKRFQCRLLHMCCTWEMVKCIIKNASVILIILGFQNTVNKQVIFPP